MNQLSLRHALNQYELKKYYEIYSCNKLSLAIYDSEKVESPLLPFSHSHEEYEFAIPLKTLNLMRYNRANYVGEVGYGFPINPNTDHGLEFELKDGAFIDIVCTKAAGDDFKRIFDCKGKELNSRFIVGKPFFDMVEKYKAEFHKEYPNETKKELIANEIIYILFRSALDVGVDNRKPEKKYACRMREIAIYMFEHYDEQDLNIDKLCKMAGYSPAYFTKAFKKFLNDSPVSHLNKIRTSEAKILFANKDLTIQEIASKVGYRNLSTFTEAFKKLMGMKPKEYRTKYY